MSNDKCKENLQTDSESQSRRARSKKGMSYYTERLKMQIVSSPNLRKSIRYAQLRQAKLLEKAVAEPGLSDDEVKELAVISNICKHHMDKGVASKTESDNKHSLDSVTLAQLVLERKRKEGE